MGYARYDFDDDDIASYEQVRAEQDAFEALAAISGTSISPYSLGLTADVADDELIDRYGPMWGRAVFAWFPPTWSYEWDDGYYSWQARQAVVLVRSDLAAAGRSSGLTGVVVQAVAEALEVWGRSDGASHQAVVDALDDVTTALQLVPPRRLWEAGLVPVETRVLTEVIVVPPGRPWIPDDFRPLADATGRPADPEAADDDDRVGGTSARG